ncbi:unnamed protein product [Rhizophagus irregularis]|nr:unnamed protein product [Rhizophagus irregularis]
MFKMLNIRENQDFPTFEDMNLKLRKLKILFEEVRTLEKKKIDFPDIYDGWLCPICRLENETFNHIWTCKENRNFISSWVDKIKDIILESVDDKKVL